MKPPRWLIHYSANVIPTESGTYHFVGFGDDLMVVRWKGTIVLDQGGFRPSGTRPGRFFVYGYDSEDY